MRVLLDESLPHDLAIGQHYLWGYMALVIVTCGAGAFSLDRLLEKRSAARCRPKMSAASMMAA